MKPKTWWKISRFMRKKRYPRRAVSRCELEIAELPQGTLATLAEGKILLNALHIMDIEELFHDETGLPVASRLKDYYKLLEKFY